LPRGVPADIKANVPKLAKLRRQVQLAADQAWPWRTPGVATIRKAFLLSQGRPMKVTGCDAMGGPPSSQCRRPRLVQAAGGLDRATMNPSAPKTKLPPSTQLQKAVFGGSQMNLFAKFRRGALGKLQQPMYQEGGICRIT
jgi:hypothetical protein